MPMATSTAGDDRAAVAHLLVAGIEDEIGDLAQGPLPPGPEFFIQQRRGPADLGAADVEAAELLR